LLAKAIKIDPRNAVEALNMADAMAEDLDFQRAVQAFKMAFPDGQPRTAQMLNHLAYLRALAGVELDQALKDVNRALELSGGDPGIMDTKAWVLHALVKDLEALAVLNDAFQKLEKRSRLAKSHPPAQTGADQTGAEQTGADQTEAGQTEELPAQTGQEHVELKEAETTVSETEQIRRRIQAAKIRLGPELWNLAVFHFHRLRIYEALHRPREAMQERQWLLEHGVPIADELF
jgi:tetratricopeptide (TPR) repeat protein